MKKICLLLFLATQLVINLFAGYDPVLPTTTFGELEGEEYEIMKITEDCYIIELDGVTFVIPKAL